MRMQSVSQISPARSGLSRPEVLVVLLLASGLSAILIPAVAMLRETSRQTQCQNHLRQLTLGMHAYHDTFRSLPPAAIWSTDATYSMQLHQSKQVDVISMQNWVQLLLPFVGEEHLATQFTASRPVGAAVQTRARMSPLALMTCPVDEENRPDNPYSLKLPDAGTTLVTFARGNYAINGGSHNFQTGPPSTAQPLGDYAHLMTDSTSRTFQMWGNGIAGINRSFSLTDFENGTGTLVAIEEVRAGIHPRDPRGVWALGQIGGSITWGHGVGGDNYRPNHLWERADDILGCGELHELVGADELAAKQMPCVHYVDVNQQATARSRHPGGVFVSFVDGSVKFLGNDIDPGLWHVLHSRETPADLLTSQMLHAERQVVRGPQSGGLAKHDQPINHAHQPLPESLENMIGMRFVRIPSGTFEMGRANAGNGRPPQEAPMHPVTLPHDFLMSTCEVTQGQYVQVSVDEAELIDGQDEYPVTSVDWNEVQDFCTRLTAMEQAAGHPRRYRLPTEAEWEYCCRSGSERPYRWTPRRGTDDDSGDAAGILPPLPLQPVGSYRPNPFGLYDMRGNAWEWTADWFARDYYARSPNVNPQGPEHGFLKVVRGSDWRFVGEICHIDYPMLPPWKGSPVVGFRLVCEITEKSDR